MMNKERILITGATGFLGYRTCEILSQKGYHILSTGRNPQEAQKLKALNIPFIQTSLKDLEHLDDDMLKNITTIIHCAALSSVWGKYVDFYEANVLGTKSLLSLCKKNNIKNFIHISTPTLYVENKDKKEIKESDPLPKTFINAYAKTKYLAEQVLQKESSFFKKLIILRPQGIYGKGDNAIKPRIMKLIHKKMIIQFGKKEKLIDITHVDNVVHAIELALQKENSFHGIFNITDNQAVNNTKYLKTIFDYLKVPYRLKIMNFHLAYFIASIFEFVHKLLRLKNEPILTKYSVITMGVDRTLDISQAKNKLGYAPIMNQQEGFNSYLKWWQEQL